MTFRLVRIITTLLRSTCFFALLINISFANEQTPNTQIKKKDRTYISAGFTLNEFRSVSVPYVASSSPGSVLGDNFPLTGQTYGLSFKYGTYITENFITELRYTTGIIEDTLDELLDVNINYAFNWYIGGTIPVTDYMSAYALAGVSFYDADVKQREVIRYVPTSEFGSTETTIRPSPTEVEEDLFGTKFSMSWMLGADFKLNDRWYLAFEYGRLLKDTDTNIKVYQAGTHLRYEF